MSLRGFMCTQRKKWVVLIFESLTERYQRFSAVMQFAEELALKNSQQPEDDQVDESLRHLKGLLGFNNQETIAQIDLALEQAAIAGHYSFPKQASQCIVLEDENMLQIAKNRNIEQQTFQEETPTKSPEKEDRRKYPNLSYQSEQENTQSLAPLKKNPTIKSRQIENHNPQRHGELVQRRNPGTVQTNKLISASGLIHNYLEKRNKERNLNLRNSQINRSIIQKSKYKVDEQDEQKFKIYLKKLQEFEEQQNIKATQKFKEKELYFLRTQNLKFPVMTLLDNEDRKFISNLQEYFGTFQGISKLLQLHAPLVSKIVASMKDNNNNKIKVQKSYSKKKKQIVDTDEEEEDDDDDEEEDDDEEFDVGDEEKDNQDSDVEQETLDSLQDKEKEKLNKIRNNNGRQEIERDFQRQESNQNQNDVGEEMSLQFQRMAQRWSKSKIEQPFAIE